MLTNVYVDGFNLYYACLKGTPYKWLDLDALCRKLLPHDSINRIRYFTARISARPGDPSGPTRQNTYLRALATIPHVTIHYGHYLRSKRSMPLAKPPPVGPETVKVIKTEEKGSDVNLATYLVVDAFRGDCEMAVVVSNDSDLCEPIRIVNDELSVPVGILTPLNPHRVQSQALVKLRPAFIKEIRTGPLAVSQFPEKLTDRHGEIRRPASW